MDAQSSSSEEKGHPQKWVKKTEQPDQNERLKGSSNVPFTKAHAGNCGDSHVSTRSDLEQVMYTCTHLCSRSCVYYKALGKRQCTWLGV